LKTVISTIMTLKEKLRELDRVQQKITVATPPQQPRSLEELLGGAEPDGCFVVERRFAVHLAQGTVRLSGMRDLSAVALAIAGKDEGLARLDLAHALFVDTETTGLAGGAGTLAFLVGVGCFEGEEFVVRQYFLRQPHEEPAMLRQLQAWVEQGSGLVTFNGKSFDVPLLRTRAVLNRLAIDFDRLPHFDVLHAARRLWKDHFESCALGELENRILQLRRSQDIPSALIPQIYFDFLRYGTTSQLPEVFAHNRQDIVSMAALLVRIAQLVQHPLQSGNADENDGMMPVSSHELRRVALLYRQLGDFEGSAKLFEQLLSPAHFSSRLEDYLALALCYKSQRRYAEANQIWRSVIERLSFHPLPYVELAKHFEHREHAADQALEWVERALWNLQLQEELGRSNGWLLYKKDLLHRRARLRRKLKSGRNQA
jgi:hypothetical protein